MMWEKRKYFRFVSMVKNIDNLDMCNLKSFYLRGKIKPS